MPASFQIPFRTHDGQTLCLSVYEEKEGTLFRISDLDAKDNNESPYQLQEGCNYEYELSSVIYTLENSPVVHPSAIHPHRGRICTNVFVGSLPITVVRESRKETVITLEIRSVKTDYRTDYRLMLEDITAHCSGLLMQQTALVNQHYTPDPACDAQTLYQRFAFVRSLIASEEFNDALHRIHRSPARCWKESETQKDVAHIKRITNQMAKQLSGQPNRLTVPPSHPLYRQFRDLPGKITVPHKEETVDTPENRFVKYTLDTFLQFCDTISAHPHASERLKEEARHTGEQLRQYLSFAFFRDVSSLTLLPFHSPVLQRKEGYREILQAWCMFDVASRLVWSGGDHVYEAGKKDVATLYEYWLFFKLLSLVEEVFHLPRTATKDLIVSTRKGMELSLTQGETHIISSTWQNNIRHLRIEFCYNKTFTATTGYHRSGSWTRRMRPDYTLSLWPEEFSRAEAEQQELIVHIHFDAKYKVDLMETLFHESDDLDQEKTAQKAGYYKRADLLKMHAYKDAIHRTAGAYILYPGTQDQIYTHYRELLPGLGAFAISPAHPTTGTNGLRQFLYDVTDHFLNRASQREKVNYHRYHILNNIQPPEVKESRSYKTAKKGSPNGSSVLIGYYKDDSHKNWILQTRLYNIRTGSGRGSLPLNEQTTGVQYLLLHGPGEANKATHLYRLHPAGPEVMTREHLLDKNYPAHPSQPFYLVYHLTEALEKPQQNKTWDITKLKPYKKGPLSAAPFIVKLEELLKQEV